MKIKKPINITLSNTWMIMGVALEKISKGDICEIDVGTSNIRRHIGKLPKECSFKPLVGVGKKKKK